MPRTIERLSSRQVATAKPGPEDEGSVLLPDGGNLYLQCTLGEGGHVRRSWIFKYEVNGRRREMGLGATHTRNLTEARAKARELRQLLQEKIDPLQVKLDRLAEKDFAYWAADYFEKHSAGWRNEKHRQQWKGTIDQVLPAIGALKISEIRPEDVTNAVARRWKTAPETAKRVRRRILRVLAYTKDPQLPSNGQTKHHEALPYAEVPQFMAKLRGETSRTAAALEFCILTAARTGEVLGARWSEIEDEVWVIPAERMKSRKQHRVPLCGRALEILQALPRRGERVFELTDSALLNLLKRLRPGVTVHGTARSSFMDWAADTTAFPREVREQCLAHAISDESEAAYRRGDLFEKRRRLMQQWAAYCAGTTPTGATVTPIRRSAS
jgi:integrase